MYSFRLLDETEKETYNRFLLTAPKTHVLQTWEWGELKSKGAWQAYRFLVEDRQKPVAGISILSRRLPVIGKVIFYAPRGPVGDLTNQEVMDFLFASLKKFAREKGAIFLKIDPDIPADETQIKDYFAARGFVLVSTRDGFSGIQPKFVFRLDLTPDEETLLANFHSKTRYNIRLAKRRGVVIKEDCTAADLTIFYNLLQETTERNNFLVRSFDYFTQMWDCLYSAGYLKLFLAYYQDEPIAGTLAYLFGDTAWYIYGASSNQHRRVMPNYLLQWTMIKWAKANGCKVYDFRGVSGDLSPDNPLYGLYRFKKGFKGTFTEFVGEYDLVFAPFYYRLWTSWEPLYQKNIRRLLSWKRALCKGD